MPLRPRLLLCLLLLGAGSVPAAGSGAPAVDTSGWDWGADESAPAPGAPAAIDAAVPPPDASETAAEGSGSSAALSPAADAAPAAGVDTSGSDWGGPARPSESMPETEAADQPGVPGTADWDWGDYQGFDTPAAKPAAPPLGPVVAPEVAPPAPPPMAEPATVSRPQPPRALPDLAAIPRTASTPFPDAPSLAVIPARRTTALNPCRNCHAWTKSDPTPRRLGAPHDGFELRHGLHGKGDFWCFTCHHLEGDGGLRTLNGEHIGFDEAYRVCRQCHGRQARDWAFGAHGKRHGNWQGERRVYDCTACHHQHAPAIPPRAPMAGPVIRQGLERPAHWAPRQQVAHDGLKRLLHRRAEAVGD